jgi:two-component sensor histidine kinase
MSVRDFIKNIWNKLADRVTSFRQKILLIAVPLLILTSIAYTIDAIRTERSIMREEIVKKAGIITELASRLGELPLISENPELIKKAISSLMGVTDISSVVFYNENSELLAEEGNISMVHRPLDKLITEIIEKEDIFDLSTPVFIVKSEEDIDIFQETENNPAMKEHVGWIRMGFSKESMQKAETALIYRAIIIAFVFIIISSIIMYKLTSAATKPLAALSNATKSVRKGTYPELNISSNDEIGTLTSEFNRMSATIHEREEMLKNSVKEKELLLREIHHRVKNNMQIISSLLNLQSEYIKESEYLDMFNESRNRIKSMAIIHEQLYQSTDLANIDFNNYVRTLVNSLISFYEKLTKNITLEVDIDNIALGVDTAIPCGLIINELVTNSLKHAFPNERDGKIIIKVNSHETDGKKNIDMTVSDNGIGMPEGLDIQNTKSLGLKLVTTLIEHQLQGNFKYNTKKGTEYQIHFQEIVYKKRL